MTTGQRTIEFYLYVSGNYSDAQTFLDAVETASTPLGYSRNGTTFTKITDYTYDEHTAETEFYPLLDTAFIAGLSVSSTMTFNNVNWN
jgi:hypothetical protein